MGGVDLLPVRKIVQYEAVVVCNLEVCVDSQIDVDVGCLDAHRDEFLVVVRVLPLGSDEQRERLVEEDDYRKCGSAFGVFEYGLLLLEIELLFGRVFLLLLLAAAEQVYDESPSFLDGFGSGLAFGGFGKIVCAAVHRGDGASVGADVCRRPFGYDDAVKLVVGIEFGLVDDAGHLSRLYVPVYPPSYIVEIGGSLSLFG